MILVLDYGSQFTQLIARRVRELGVYCHIVPFDDAKIEEEASKASGVIFSGGPNSVYEDYSPSLPAKDSAVFSKPVLGICYGAQLLAQEYGGKVVSVDEKEFGKAELNISKEHALFDGIDLSQAHTVWMSHGDSIDSLPKEFTALANSENCPFAAFAYNNMFGLQFHPEVTHTSIGKTLIKNFVENICQAEKTWSMKNFGENQMAAAKAKVGDKHVICGLSGGVDSSVVSVLLHKAIGKQLTSIFVDHGMLRFNERQEVEKAIRDAFDLNLIVVDASDEFLTKLEGVTDPEKKRKIIGATFIDVFEREAKKIDNVAFLAQGTLYPDVIESVSHRGPSVTIKSHHNVGGLPEKMNLQLIEPVRELFKDEVRALGAELGLPKHFLARHPFPGPGLAVRILGEITRDRIDILQAADHIFIEELKKQNLYDEVWQAFAVLLPVKTVGVMGDARTYENVCSLRAVTSVDGMTANWAFLPHEFLAHVSNRIINEVRGINRVAYDISSKPPATIEWE